eukprot:CAMPEP_0115218014 /NCGR_PEP_ID=MMETSP0270-20121206/26163_1 /TAXON_ID=71861 /ORGANISM="Scrippsiella trochoidea, Strain CCMP3099" /LENGTH=1238 /DNA_ID=CAMNT_0002631925 /DNA_START=40 /DNA_END=3758 /DNA_ORIENTATION=+
MEVYAWGSGNYGRLGLGHSGDAHIPQHVSGVLNGCDVTNTACGWYHSAVVTSTGEVASFGSRVTKNLGIADSGSEASDVSETSEPSDPSANSSTEGEAADLPSGATRQPARRSGTHPAAGSGKRRRPPRLSLRTGAGDRQRSTADFVPQILRSFPSRVTVVQVAVGSDMLGAHTLAVSRTGRLYSWGYGPACGLGSTTNVGTPTLVTKFLGMGAGEHSRDQLAANELEPLGGDVTFTFGLSAGGRLGFRTKFRAQLRPRRIETLSEGTMDLATGAGFVLLCSAAGRLLAWGDNTKGQLGIGHLQESHEPVALGRVCPAAFVMQAVAAGDSHSLALDSSGRTYSWGGEGGPMTGQGQALPNPMQVDAAFQFRLRTLPHWWVRPTLLRALLGTKVVFIAAGCLHSLALSQDGALFAWGASLQSGASASSASVSADKLEKSWVPRLLAPSPKLPLVRIGSVSAGGWHSLVSAMPSCPIERLSPTDDEHTDYIRSFCDGFLTSELDSDSTDEACVPLCCAAVRARFASSSSKDPQVWIAFSAQVKRFAPEPVASWMQESDEEDGHGSSGESGLMDIVAMHRERPRTMLRAGRTARARAREVAPSNVVEPPQTSDADEAAGKARPTTVDAELTKQKAHFDEGLAPKPPDVPEAKACMMRRRVRQSVQWPRPPPEFSSDSSSSSERPQTRVPTGSRSVPRAQGTPKLGVELSRYSEAVLTALVRFLHTDSLGSSEVIDETHPVWQREQHLRLRPLGPGPGEAEEWVHERPSMHRALKGLLLRREINDLRLIGTTLGLQRLARLCDQLLHRIDAPGLPALFVPASTLGMAMRTLLQQARALPAKDGCDTVIFAVLLYPGTADAVHEGLQQVDGSVHTPSSYARAAPPSAKSPAPLKTRQKAGPRLHPAPSGKALADCDAAGPRGRMCASSWICETSLQTSSGLGYLYTQDDLSSEFPLEGEQWEDVVAAERFWIELLRLSQRLGDDKLFLYAQDTLVGTLSIDNWAHLAMFAEQAQCRVLSEAALMMGLRMLQPAMLTSFHVPSGLEAHGQQGEQKDSPASGIPEPAATVGGASSSSGGVARGSVDLELERHLLGLRVSSHGAELASVLALKKGSPSQYVELKQRLAESITMSQKVGSQLAHCARFFDSHERRGFDRDDNGGRVIWIEIAALIALLGFFIIPSAARQMAVALLVSALEPIRAWSSFIDWGWLSPLASGATRVIAVNVVMFALLCFVVWSGLKGES